MISWDWLSVLAEPRVPGAPHAATGDSRGRAPSEPTLGTNVKNLVQKLDAAQLRTTSCHQVMESSQLVETQKADGHSVRLQRPDSRIGEIKDDIDQPSKDARFGCQFDGRCSNAIGAACKPY